MTTDDKTLEVDCCQLKSQVHIPRVAKPNQCLDSHVHKSTGKWAPFPLSPTFSSHKKNSKVCVLC